MAYQGVYLLVEAVARGEHHVDITALEPGDTLAPAITGGYILQVDRVGHDDEYFTVPGDPRSGHPDTIIFVDPRHPAAPQKQWLASYFESIGLPLGEVTWRLKGPLPRVILSDADTPDTSTSTRSWIS